MINVIVTSSIIIAVILIIRAVLGRRIKSGALCVLWGLVALRLLIPVQLFDNVVNTTDYMFNYIYNIRTPVTAQEAGVQTNVAADGDDVSYSGIKDTLSENLPKTNVEQVEDLSRENNHNGVTLKVILRIIWLVGIAAVVLVTFLNNLIFRKKLISTREYVGTRGNINIYQSNLVSAPCLYGIFHPAIYINQGVEADEYIIRHEMIHYRHRDNWWAVLRILCVSIYWFNPMVWIAAHFHRTDSEFFCDDCAIKEMDETERVKYGTVLLEAASGDMRRQTRIYPLAGATSGFRELKRRITRITDNKKKYRSITFAVIVLVAVITVVAFGNGNIRKVVTDIVEKPANKTQMQYITVGEYMYDLTHDGINDNVVLRLYGFPEDVNDIENSLNDTRKYVNVAVYDGNTGKELYVRSIGVSGSANGFVSIVTRDGAYYLLEGNMGVWQGDGLKVYTIYDFTDGNKTIIDSHQVSYYVTEASIERAEKRGEDIISKEEADERFNAQAGSWTESEVMLVKCLNHEEKQEVYVIK